MKTLYEQNKNSIKNSLLFLLGIIVTIIITKFFDKIIPNDPVIVKEYTDTIKIFHNYNIPNNLNDDSTRLELESKIKNLELLNSYDKQIRARIELKNNKDGIFPNLIITSGSEKIKNKGYTYGNSSAYFNSNCPEFNKEYLDIKIDFINPDITKEIAYLRINIYKFDNPNSSEARTHILEELFEVKPDNNIIRISNDFSKGKYEILYGFMFKDELKKTYPTFNFKKCIITN
ncbi:hypothetical protein [Flavobacterium sp.]|uniref:hypothetical protein n=1 Tax=Flavobacterium sp. TaxID=239 RepID=UPI0035B43D33